MEGENYDTATTGRASSALDRIEALYLKALRAALLIAATALLCTAIVWAGVGLVRIVRSPDSVVEKPSTVASSELISATSQDRRKGASTGAKAVDLRGERAFYDDFVKKYFALYRANYQPSQRAEDKKLTAGEFDDLTINTAGRLEAIQRGDLSFATDRQDLMAFLPVVTETSGAASTVERLAKYRTAKKAPTATNVQRTRTESRRGWDTLSTDCSLWYESPVGCPVTRSVEVPYTERVTVMRYPEGIASPTETLKAYQDKYFELLAERRMNNASTAADERQAIADGNVEGWSGLTQSVMIIGGFLLLMFFFLLVAIERHQRKLVLDRAAVADLRGS